MCILLLLLAKLQTSTTIALILVGASLSSSDELDDCIVWNAHNTVFGSTRSAICTQAVYFLHLTMLSVACD